MAEFIEKMLNFIDESKSAYHGIENIKNRLESEGFQGLLESEKWNLEEEGKYYVERNGSSIIAFKIPKKSFSGFSIVASHSDSPGLKLKSNPVLGVDDKYLRLNIEKYGGLIMSSWFDRPLSIAGRVLLKDEKGFRVKNVDVDRDLLILPNLAIHMNRDINSGYSYNVQKDLLPLLGDYEDKKEGIMDIISRECNIDSDSILSGDLFVYNRDKGRIIGRENEYFCSPRIDNLECAYTTLMGFIEEDDIKSVALYCVFDNEEIGSGTKQGAASTFLYDTLRRISHGFYKDEDDYYRLIASSFMLSADNAHACHPNYPEKADIAEKTYMNKGPVLKYNAEAKYTTDAIAAGFFKYICKEAGIPYQEYHNRSDIPGGSTLGHISNEKVSLNTADIGLAQLAMHSANETAGCKDALYMTKLVRGFYAFGIKESGLQSYTLL
ncbi:aspartyl aminopeptidase [Acetitomaculum ruminis DSM 5522]|uniref:M18 family aminopeptidase n=1 Tax=Acetitomaculum ruminis DSM 5522 TaxID=1120918 RepID=A0A1I0W734_9FIRM|nr:M18 family aminopeptidase [Acetitomaculum ruminis]SFA84127.1 aspartyl aminopeptidase [Acetitomaculum ruminis DSM 5522]